MPLACSCSCCCAVLQALTASTLLCAAWHSTWCRKGGWSGSSSSSWRSTGTWPGNSSSRSRVCKSSRSSSSSICQPSSKLQQCREHASLPWRRCCYSALCETLCGWHTGVANSTSCLWCHAWCAQLVCRTLGKVHLSARAPMLLSGCARVYQAWVYTSRAVWLCRLSATCCVLRQALWCVVCTARAKFVVAFAVTATGKSA